MNFDPKPISGEQKNAHNETFEMLCVIASWKMKKKLLDVLSDHGCIMISVIHGEGSYRPSHNFLDFIPASSPEKVVIFAICKAQNLPVIYDSLNDRLSFNKRDVGIACSLNVDEITKQNKAKILISQQQSQVKDELKMKLLYLIVNNGFSGDILALLDDAGASGATILPARGRSGCNTILGVLVEPAKEIVLSVVSDKVCLAVIEMIERGDMLPKAANGIVISLSVSSVNHINKFVREEG